MAPTIQVHCPPPREGRCRRGRTLTTLRYPCFGSLCVMTDHGTSASLHNRCASAFAGALSGRRTHTKAISCLVATCVASLERRTACVGVKRRAQPRTSSSLTLVRLYIEPPCQVSQASAMAGTPDGEQTCRRVRWPALPMARHRFRRPRGTQSVGVPQAAFAQQRQKWALRLSA